jgi:hypothetical protein
MEELKIYQFSYKNKNSIDFITVVASNKDAAKEKVLTKTSTLGTQCVDSILDGHCIDSSINDFIAQSSDNATSLSDLLLKK